MTQNQISNVLVTGGSGFLGSHIVQQLLEEKTDGTSPLVTCISRNPKGAMQNPRVVYKICDITNEKDVQELFNNFKPQVIIHTVSPSQDEWPSVLEHTNIGGTRTLLRYAASCPETRAFVFTSSNSAIVATQTPLSEADSKFIHQSSNAYARTKAEAERMVLATNGPDLRTATLRLPAIYGENDHNFLPQLVQSIKENKHRIQVGQNEKLWEFLYIKKAAEGHILAAKALLRNSGPKVDGEAFFLTDGKPQLFFDFCAKAYAAAGHPVAPEKVTKVPLGLIQSMASVGEWLYFIFTLNTLRPVLRRHNIDVLNEGCHWSIEKAKERLGYEPLRDQDEAIKRSMEWAMEELWNKSSK